MLWASPRYWHFTPDSGIYVGSAQSLVETGRYHFNGHPNLLYYPGFSALLSLPIAVFGVDFRVLHLVCTALGLAGLWLIRAYFSVKRYAWTGLLLPFVLLGNDLVGGQLSAVLSDATFLTASIAALLLWRRHDESGSRRALVACAAMTAYASLVRFQGFFLCAAFAGALALPLLRERAWTPRRVVTSAALALLAFAPFALWTLRNVLVHTPDTYNQANRFFFGLNGLRLYVPGYMRVDWIDAEWMYGLQNLRRMVWKLVEKVLGDPTTLGPESLWIMVVVGTIAVGGRAWFRKATSMERLYVALSIAFLVWDSLRRRNLYTVARYWVPMLPFLLAAGGEGLSAMLARVRTTRFRPLAQAAAFLLIAALTARSLRAASPRPPDLYWRNSNQTLKELAAYVRNNVPRDAKFATTDWGPLPWALERTSYMVLNDKSHLLTLQRIHRYQASYLAILGNRGGFVKEALNMTRDHPKLFHVDYAAKERPGARGVIFRIDLEAVDAYLRARSSAAARRQARARSPHPVGSRPNP